MIYLTEYKKPSITVDIIIFNETISVNKKDNSIEFNENTEFILIKRKNHPFKNHWAIPGGFVDYGESVENSAIRESKEETAIDIQLKKLFNVYSDPNRDPRGHTITIVYLATGNFNKMNAESDAVDIGIFSFNDIKIMDLSFDHKKILNDVCNDFNKKIVFND
ncbi:ADP-ribose pyrophosphatase [Candidatus Methanobinarius endosymbioticus]|uniref:ADP-ribose pyrophosphatase n=1 Tax=Candidatus Methanobinarius endosymbioticus TaxID=2006182 RepID=A0A366MCQ6_9EURY|nr:ADP-ribose pyrophosphatase [Candidatus Methanobinarius endosymbioticus]